MTAGASSGLEAEKLLPSTNGSVTKSDRAAGNKASAVPDAGLRSLDHYKRALPPWRYTLRQSMLPLVRWETPYLAYMQELVRTPKLDRYFAVTANLGTHTFFMISLPVMYWCGFPWLGNGLVHILASGVFFTGFVKDLVSLPRPLSPPLHRITMSGSAALEYGFPSTHSANAVSVAVYGLFLLRSETNPLPPNSSLFLEVLAYFYATSVVFGRLYCGMHGFFDVLVGSIMGAALGCLEYYYGARLNESLVSSTWVAPLVRALIILALVRVHPEPADDCPCFDDSVAFAGVMIGIEVGTWHHAQSSFSFTLPQFVGSDDPFATASALGWFKLTARIVLGVLVIFVWREVMKPLLLRLLPHVFRLLETTKMDMPRRFFTTAKNYKNVPLRLKMDNVMPNVSDIPIFISSFKNPGRGRSVSVGPQSAADAYETLAYRERRRRQSLGSNFNLKTANDDAAAATEPTRAGSGHRDHQRHHQSPLEMYEQMMGQGRVMVADDGTGFQNEAGGQSEEPEIYISKENELGEREVLTRLVRPRVRYDVEVVTKLVVYTGIAWLSAEIVPILFEFVGLGIGDRR